MNYNTSRQVLACIKSLCHESLHSIVVVDNYSPDDDPESISIAHPDVILIRHPQNVGFGAGCNVGMQWVFENTDSDFILFLNPDTVIEPGLIIQLESRLTEKGIGIVAPRITMMSEQDKLWYGGGYFSWLKGSATADRGRAAVNHES